MIAEFQRCAVIALLAILSACTNLDAEHLSTGVVPTQDRPNVLLILVDDLKPAVGAYGDRHAITPNLDAFAARGVRFDMAYANQAVCGPSRYNLMLGTRSTSSGIYDFGRSLRGTYPDAVTMPQHFMAAGYHAESMGKVYHFGHGQEGDPASWSVPHFKDKVIEYVLPESTEGGQLTREEALFGNLVETFQESQRLPRGMAWEKADVPDEAYADGRVAARAVRRLGELAGDERPFFLAVGFSRPHLPFSVPTRYWDMYDAEKLPLAANSSLPEGAPPYAGKRGGEITNYAPIPPGRDIDRYDEELQRELVHGYYASVSYVDAQIGKVLRGLDAAGLADNTIVMVWGDHGFHLGDHGIWTKHTNYEEAARIPLMFAGHGVTRSGVSSDQLAETVDIFPTLSALAGLPRPAGPQPIDGVDLTPALTDDRVDLRPYAYHAYARGPWLGAAIRDKRYRIVRWTNPARPKATYELYDLIADPGETRNIAADDPQAFARMSALLALQPEPVAQAAR